MLLALVGSPAIRSCLFALDGTGGISRYRLLPLRGWPGTDSVANSALPLCRGFGILIWVAGSSRG
jgi:hypothetical protein